MDTIADRTRKARIAAGFKSAADAARRLGMEPHAYRHYESGARTPPTDRLTDIAKAFRVDLDWLLTGKGSPQQPEAEVIRLWSGIPDSNKEAAIRMLRALTGTDPA